MELLSRKDISFFNNIIRKAGFIARQVQRKTIEIIRKDDSSIVTKADYLVQEYLLNKITARFKGINTIHEENYNESGKDVDDDTISVIIDPIDGTAMFSMYLPNWCVSIGIFKGYQPKYGFVYSPGYRMLFHNDDNGSYLNGEIRRVNRSPVIDSETNLFFASEVHNIFTINFPGKIRNIGSTALHACLTIDNTRNRVLASIGKSNLWDWAGALPIVVNAGGQYKYLSGEEVNMERIFKENFSLTDYLIVYNLDDFDAVQKIFA